MMRALASFFRAADKIVNCIILFLFLQVYYFAMAEDFVLRFIWVVNNTLWQMGIDNRDHLILKTVLSLLEVLR